MSRYFLDKEFLEGTQETFLTRNKNTIKVFFIATGIMQLSYMIIDENMYGVIGGVLWLTLGLLFDKNQNKSKPTIDLISIGIVSEDGREYYAISKDFNLKEAWNRYDLKEQGNFGSPIDKPSYGKVYWIRDNVLKPIYKELYNKENLNARQALYRANVYISETKFSFTYNEVKKLINKYGKTNKQIAEEVKEFCLDTVHTYKSSDGKYIVGIDPYKGDPEFYGYYCDYDWVVFCWLFGKMIDLPKGFPMYCIDLKQMLDEKVIELDKTGLFTVSSFEEKIKALKTAVTYPKQTNEHNALSDARWNHELYKFIQKL